MAFSLRKHAGLGDAVGAGPGLAPVAPGAVSSPQIPGQVPDRSSVPEQGVLPVPPDPDHGSPTLPLSELGTSQHIMRVYAPVDGNDDDPARFEQAPVSYEEMRKATPLLRTPLKPAPGYALAAGARRAGAEMAALAAGADTEGPAPGE